MKIIKLAVASLALLLIGMAHGDLETTLNSSTDNQTSQVEGYQYVSNLVLDKNVTLVGPNATIDGTKSELIPQVRDRNRHTTVTLKGLTFRNCLSLNNYDNLIIGDCQFIDSWLDIHGSSILVKNSTFRHCVNGSSVGFGGAINLYNSSAMFDHCAFVNNSAYRTGTWNGSSGGTMRINRSTTALIEPIIERNLAAYGGGICAVDSDLFIYGGRIIHNEAREVNLSPTSKLGGVGRCYRYYP